MQNTAKNHLFSIKQFRRCNMGPRGIRCTESGVFVDSTVGTTHHWALPGYISSLLGLFFADLSSLLIIEVAERALCNPSTDEKVSLGNVFSFKDRSVMCFFFFQLLLLSCLCVDFWLCVTHTHMHTVKLPEWHASKLRLPAAQWEELSDTVTGLTFWKYYFISGQRG